MKSLNVLNWGILGTGMIAGRFAEVVGGGPNWNAAANTLGNLRVLEELRKSFSDSLTLSH